VIPKEIRDLIREMSRANWLWGAPRIHGEVLKLGIEVVQSTVAKYMVKHPRRTPSAAIFLYYPSRRQVPVRLQAFIEFLRENLRAQ
jgi:DNA-binding transcriptional LysR family regulator